MMENRFVSLRDMSIALPLLQDIVDESSLKIISSIIDVEKNVFQICFENKLPPSSTYKKIRKLQSDGLVSVEKIDIDSRGKKVVFYKSNIKSLDFNLKKEGIILQFDRNDRDHFKSAADKNSNYKQTALVDL
jgi:predicted transcriptional regulator